MTFCADPQSNERRRARIVVQEHVTQEPSPPPLSSLSQPSWTFPVVTGCHCLAPSSTFQKPYWPESKGCQPNQWLLSSATSPPPLSLPNHDTCSFTLFPLGNKLERPKQRFKQKPANWDNDANFELLFKENDLWEYMKLNHPFLKPTDKVHSQNHLFAQGLKEGMPSLAPFGKAVKAAGRTPPKLSPQQPLH